MLVAAAVPALAPPAGAQGSPERRLAAKYAPIVMLRAQYDPPCDKTREQYLPTTVDVVLGNPRVELVPPSGSARPKKRAPTAADVAGLGSNWYLDLPGNPLSPGCTFARDFAGLRRGGRAPALTYAHIARQRGRAGIALQYWFFYYFNQFNDLHESDWEGMQILFDSDSASGALAGGPSEIGLFQHAGGERADWDDEKVEKRGNHPVVYPAAGSHATFYESSIFLENGRGGSGLGCDNSSEPVREVRPKPVLVATRPPPGSTHQWLTYEGRWGQREKGFNNGPQGPNTKLQWLKPFDKQDEMRYTSAQLPSGSVIGPTVTSAFCVTVAELSAFLNLATDSPPGAIALGLGDPRPRARSRLAHSLAAGGGSAASSRARDRPAAAHGPPGLHPLLARPGSARSQLAGDRGRVRGTAPAARAHLRGWGSRPRRGLRQSGSGLYGSVVVDRVDGRAGHRLGRDRRRSCARSTAVGSGSGRGLPRAAAAGLACGRACTFWSGRWRCCWSSRSSASPTRSRSTWTGSSTQQEVLFEDRSLREALRGSTRVVRGHWWHTAATVLVLVLLGWSPGPCWALPSCSPRCRQPRSTCSARWSTPW